MTQLCPLEFSIPGGSASARGGGSSEQDIPHCHAMGFGSPTPNETTDNGPRACTARAVVGVEDGGEAVVMAPLAVTPEGATFGVASLYQVCITGERVAPAPWHRDRRRLSIFPAICGFRRIIATASASARAVAPILCTYILFVCTTNSTVRWHEGDPCPVSRRGCPSSSTRLIKEASRYASCFLNFPI